MNQDEINIIRDSWLIKAYNKITECDLEFISDIPVHSLIYLKRIDYKELIKPFIIERFAMENHKDRRHIANIFGITERQARTIGKKHGYYG